MNDEVRFLSVCGMLGYGYPAESLERGVEGGVDFLGVDAGSTGPGPYYLGSGVNFVKPMQVKRDLAPALCAARRLGAPFIIGSAGGSGAKPHVEAFLDLLRDVARRCGLHFRLAVIHADLDPDAVKAALKDGRITSCGPAQELTEEAISSCTHLVAQMGTGPIIEALDAGADVIVAGRCCDTAIFAALPILRGLGPGLALHCGKIAECGALCAAPAGANDSLIGVVRKDHFLVEPANPERRCTPESVAAHALYEQPDPTCFYEPEGKVDMAGCAFEPHGERGVKVSGTRLIRSDTPAIKLEGAALRGYRSITIAGVRDPLITEHIDDLESVVRDTVADNLKGAIEPGDYSLRFLRYGRDAVMGPLEPPSDGARREIGLLIEAIAPTQELADTVLRLARSTAQHQSFPMRKTTGGNLAFPFSPSDLRGGAVYEFAVYHLMVGEDIGSLFPVTLEEV
ncbi:MAG: DUF1446 domain-containing protein [Planctomycetes bacterium]|nr:DUF1446 domain-containing protein [Planctomycetota bacterium]